MILIITVLTQMFNYVRNTDSVMIKLIASS